MAVLVHIVISSDELVQLRGGANHWTNIDHYHNNDDNNQGDDKHCSREYPLTQKGPRQLSYEFKRYDIVPYLLEEAPSHYIEVSCCITVYP